jgi:formylglycine-generating enzyme required for sulfatase activity
VLEWEPNPNLVADPEVRRQIVATGAPWRVLHEPSGVEFLLVPTGSYLRGARSDDPYDRQNERPQHLVRITHPYYLGRFEVTNAQMKRFRPEHDSGSFYRDESFTLNDDDMPAVRVSWLDATGFVEHFGFRLPTEGEWEYAARAGVGSRYPWGDDPDLGKGWGNVFNESVKETIPEMDWAAFGWDDGFVVSSPVGSFRPNGWGFYDLFANVWEWCQDAYLESEYQNHVDGAIDPVAQGEGRHSLRGGGFGNSPRGSGIPYRFGMLKTERHDANGFRVARSLDIAVPQE